MPTNSSKSSEGLRKRPWCSVGFVTCCEFADVPSTCWFLARITRQTLATEQPNLKFGDTMKVHFICESRIVSVDHAPVFQLKIPAGTLRVFLQNSSLWHFGGNDWNGLSSHHEFGKASELASQISIPARLTNRRRSFQPSGRRCPKMSAGGKVNFCETHGWSCWYLPPVASKGSRFSRLTPDDKEQTWYWSVSTFRPFEEDAKKAKEAAMQVQLLHHTTHKAKCRTYKWYQLSIEIRYMSCFDM